MNYYNGFDNWNFDTPDLSKMFSNKAKTDMSKMTDTTKMFSHCTVLNYKFVLLHWFYDGDSNLVDSFVGVFNSYKDTEAFCNEKYDSPIILKDNEFETYNGEKEPKDWGNYGSESKFEIRKVKVL